MKQQPHFFFAVSIPEETKIMMKKHFEQLKEKMPFSRWVHHEDLHITLAFLGDAPTEKLHHAEKNVITEISGFKPFKLQIQQLGFFGKTDSPRIFWADTIGSTELNGLRNKVFMACEDAGFQLEKRRFCPHMTLARKWQGERPFQTESLEIWKELQPEPIVFDVTEVVLYQTHLYQTPKYEAISRIPLR
ncbi:MAG TPA: RNA 2',3'-cyclic phosphodiesterase [Bacillales bacterium]|nr:RNA 2',3'-cyclic phosphodiesterase [Bacillales bacterium]